jgi:hypothetical protein
LQLHPDQRIGGSAADHGDDGPNPWDDASQGRDSAARGRKASVPRNEMVGDTLPVNFVAIGWVLLLALLTQATNNRHRVVGRDGS